MIDLIPFKGGYVHGIRAGAFIFVLMLPAYPFHSCIARIYPRISSAFLVSGVCLDWVFILADRFWIYCIDKDRMIPLLGSISWNHTYSYST